MYQIFFFLITYSLIAVLRKEIKSSILFIVPSLPPILITSPHLNRGLFSGVLPTKFSFHEHPYELVLALQRVLLMAPYMFFFPEKSFRSLVFLVLPSPVFSSHTDSKIYHEIFLSETNRFFSSILFKGQSTDPQVTAGRIVMIYNSFFVSINRGRDPSIFVSP